MCEDSGDKSQLYLQMADPSPFREKAWGTAGMVNLFPQAPAS